MTSNYCTPNSYHALATSHHAILYADLSTSPLSSQIDASVIFFVTFERGEKYAELPPSLRTHEDVLLAILHNRNLLNNRNYDFHEDDPQGWTTTFTNCEDGVSILDQGGIADITLHWRLTRADGGSTDVLQCQGNHIVESTPSALQDNVLCRCLRPLKCVFKIKDDNSPMMKVLLALLGRIAASAAVYEGPAMLAGEQDEGG